MANKKKAKTRKKTKYTVKSPLFIENSFKTGSGVHKNRDKNVKKGSSRKPKHKIKWKKGWEE
jgi:hypothetical protein